MIGVVMHHVPERRLQPMDLLSQDCPWCVAALPGVLLLHAARLNSRNQEASKEEPRKGAW